MPFQKGVPRPPNAGRKKGTPDKHSGTVAAMCRDLIESPDYQANFQQRFKAGTLAPMLEALTWHYAYGKPIERHDFGQGAFTLTWKS